MNDSRFQEITDCYPQLSVAVIGDYCLDRYLEIDPSRSEVSIETGLEVFNVNNVRSQPGGCGTILSNLIALGCANLFPVGFAGEDGDGYELLMALKANKSVNLKYFLQTSERRTFTYCKPLVMDDSCGVPRELNRFDSKNWTNTPEAVQLELAASITQLATQVDAIVLLGQVDQPGTGVLCGRVLAALRQVRADNPDLLIIADSRSGFADFPNVCLKTNRGEFLSMINDSLELPMPELMNQISILSDQRGQGVFVSLSEGGIAGAFPGVGATHVAGLPCDDEIDVVGAGDAVMANLALALAANASVVESMRIAMAAASIVVRQLGTTGVAARNEIAPLLKFFDE